eukprot:14713592-Alexandrium_andersonii.AAC.1
MRCRNLAASTVAQLPPLAKRIGAMRKCMGEMLCPMMRSTHKECHRRIMGLRWRARSSPL